MLSQFRNEAIAHLGVVYVPVDAVVNLKNEGLTILLVEQNVREALEMSDRRYVLQTGRIVQEGLGAELLRSDKVHKAFLGL
jgi:branched-chain amino acid transport system ATP-binding protein